MIAIKTDCDNKALERAEIIAALRCCGNTDTKRPDCEHCPLMGTMCVKRMLEGAAALLEQAAEPPNDPLTLEELRGMDGEPVWVRHTNGGTRCRICAGVYDNPQTGGSEVLFEGTPDIVAWDGGKTWLAYRRKPDGGGE